MIRAVIDPGVLIAGLITPGGLPSDIIRTWKQGVFELVVSPPLLDELTVTLLRPKFRRWVSESDAVAFVEVLRLSAVMVEDPAEVEPISRDPNDDYLIALAREARANVLVSSDADLTSIHGNGPPIVTPRQFLSSITR
ncbi:MAG: putative toxin-antitoxin system toxin component, PIN family [Actinomycetota bacterium]